MFAPYKESLTKKKNDKEKKQKKMERKDNKKIYNIQKKVQSI